MIGITKCEQNLSIVWGAMAPCAPWIRHWGRCWHLILILLSIFRLISAWALQIHFMDPLLNLNVKRLSTVSYELCYICQTSKNDQLSSATDKGLPTIRQATNTRQKMRDSPYKDAAERINKLTMHLTLIIPSHWLCTKFAMQFSRTKEKFRDCRRIWQMIKHRPQLFRQQPRVKLG